MKKSAKGRIVALVLLVAACWLGSASADTGIGTGNDASADAHLNFRIQIPSFIYFRVGAAASVDTVEFQPDAQDVAEGNPGTAAQGTSGSVDVVLIGNVGGINLIAEGDANGLSDGGSNYISYAQIQTASQNGDIPAPVLTNGTSAAVSVPTTTGAVTVQNDTWIYTYDNPATPPAPGLYTGQVTYTASAP